MTKNNNNYHTFYDVTAETIMSVVESLTNKDGNINYVSDFSGITGTYARRAVNFGINLGLIIKDEDGENYKLSPLAKSLSIKFNQNKHLIFREKLFQFKPFIFISSQVVNGEKIETAIRKMKAVYQIDTDPKLIRRLLNNYTRFIGLEEFSKESLNSFVNDDLEIDTNKLIRIINNEFELNIYLANKLGEECFNFLNNPEKKLLIDGLKKHSKNSANSISDAAGALESFLRRVGTNNGISLDKLNGIGQVAQTLASKNHKLILPEHKSICEFVGTFRNPSSHRVQKNILEHWKFYEDTTLEIILLCISSIRSIFEYVYKNKLVL